MAWNSNNNYNKFKSTYIKDTLDISGILILRKNTDILFETNNTYTLSGLISQSNAFISSYQSYTTLYNKYVNDLLTISSTVKTYIDTLTTNNSIKNKLYTAFYTLSISSYIINVPKHIYTPQYDLSGNYSGLQISISGYTQSTGFTTISGLLFTISGSTFGASQLVSLQTQYSSALSSYNNSQTTLNYFITNMLSISNTIFINKNNLVSQNIPIYKSLLTTLNDYQNQLNTISYNINPANIYCNSISGNFINFGNSQLSGNVGITSNIYFGPTRVLQFKNDGNFSFNNTGLSNNYAFINNNGSYFGGGISTNGGLIVGSDILTRTNMYSTNITISGIATFKSVNINGDTRLNRIIQYDVSNNVYIGDCFNNNRNGVKNVAIGYLSLNSDNIGNYNVGIGYKTLNSNNSGNYNLAIGSLALQLNTTGSFNTGIGIFALNNNSTGSKNVAIGYDALVVNSTGDFNTALGMNALSNGNTSYCIGIGAYSGVNNYGANNTFIGAYTDQDINDPNNLYYDYKNSTAIGYGSLINNNHQIKMGTNYEYIQIDGSMNVIGPAFFNDITLPTYPSLNNYLDTLNTTSNHTTISFKFLLVITVHIHLLQMVKYQMSQVLII